MLAASELDLAAMSLEGFFYGNITLNLFPRTLYPSLKKPNYRTLCRNIRRVFKLRILKVKEDNHHILPSLHSVYYQLCR